MDFQTNQEEFQDFDFCVYKKSKSPNFARSVEHDPHKPHSSAAKKWPAGPLRPITRQIEPKRISMLKVRTRSSELACTCRVFKAPRKKADDAAAAAAEFAHTKLHLLSQSERCCARVYVFVLLFRIRCKSHATLAISDARVAAGI
jgi:hypothetical protein